LLIGCDLVVAASAEALAKLDPETSRAIVNGHETITGDFTRNPDLAFPAQDLRRAVVASVGQGHAAFVDATRLATGLLGDSIATNLFMLGYAYQQGLVPVSQAAIERAIELNAVAVDFNRSAFRWGRRAAVDPGLVEARAAPQDTTPAEQRLSETLDEAIARRIAFLTRYQSVAYAERYAARMRRVREAEAVAVPGATELTDAAARALFKVMAYKDEYEVARLYADTDFTRSISARFDGPYRLRFHLAPPILGNRDPETGHLQKRAFGGWMLAAFRVLAKFRFLRGTAFDIFGRSPERRAERALIVEYETRLDEICAGLSAANHAVAATLAAVPLEIRGFGHVKEASLARARSKADSLLAQFRSPPPRALAAE
jgi:indolepyruvate ferredoxin oxidoreductase